MTATRRAGRAWPRLPELWDRFRTHEGEIIPRGFSWDSSAHSRVLVYFRLWNRMLRVRRPRDGRWEVRWFRAEHRICKGVTYDFEYQAIEVNGVKISLELLDVITRPNPERVFRFERQGNTVIVTEVQAKSRWEV